MGNTEEWLKRVENAEFQKYYGRVEAPADMATWDQPQGFGMERLKTCPSGFPRDWEHVEYLRQKDYCCWHRVDDSFFEGDHWLDEIETMFRAAKPMMDMMNSVIDDYE